MTYPLNNRLGAAVRRRLECPLSSILEAIFSAPYGPVALIAAGLCSHIPSSFI